MLISPDAAQAVRATICVDQEYGYGMGQRRLRLAEPRAQITGLGQLFKPRPLRPYVLSEFRPKARPKSLSMRVAGSSQFIPRLQRDFG